MRTTYAEIILAVIQASTLSAGFKGLELQVWALDVGQQGFRSGFGLRILGALTCASC